MSSLLVLLLACAGSPAAPRELPSQLQIQGVQLQLPERGLSLAAQQASLADQQLGRAEQVQAQVGSQPGLNIESSSASWDLRGQRVVFEGEVRAVRGSFTLECERLEVEFSAPEQLQRAVATGGVRVRHGERIATGERADLHVPSGRLVLSGDPQIVEGRRRLQGEQIVLLLDDERLECLGCKLEIPAAESNAAPAGAP